MLNKNLNLILSLLILTIFITASPAAAENFESPEEFTEYIYQNYSQENFKKVYQNFVPELKRVFEEKDYLDFQKENFEKYNLEYTNIEVGEAKKIDYNQVKSKFNYADDFGEYYQLSVSYLLKFDHFGEREEKSGKKVYLRKIVDTFQVFWNPETVSNDQSAEVEVDQDGQ